MSERSCLTCKHWLGGVYSCCRINLEAECAKGEHEAWEAKRPASTQWIAGRGFRAATSPIRSPSALAPLGRSGPLGMATRQEEAPRRDAIIGVREPAPRHCTSVQPRASGGEICDSHALGPADAGRSDPAPTAADVISHLQIIRTWAAWGDQHGTGIAEAACAPIVDWIDDATALLKEVAPDV